MILRPCLLFLNTRLGAGKCKQNNCEIHRRKVKTKDAQHEMTLLHMSEERLVEIIHLTNSIIIIFANLTNYM